MAAANQHTLLKLGGAAAAAFVGYEFIYKPWRAAKDAALAASAGSLSPGGLPYTITSGGGNFGLPYITTPQSIGPMPSNLDPGAAVGGPVGYCMHKKGWTQNQCTSRYNAIVTAYQAAVTEIQKLQTGTAQAATQAQITSTQAAIAQAQAALNAAFAAGNVAQVDALRAKIAAWSADVAALQTLLNQAGAKLASYQSAVAGLASDFQNLFGIALGGVQPIAA